MTTEEALRSALENILDCVENHGGHDMVVKPTKELFGRQILMSELIREVLSLPVETKEDVSYKNDYQVEQKLRMRAEAKLLELMGKDDFKAWRSDGRLASAPKREG